LAGCRIAARAASVAPATAPEVIERIESLRRQRMPGKEIAATVGVSPATVSRVLKRLGLSKLSALEPVEAARRYQRERPRRDDPHRHQKARQVRPDRPSPSLGPQGPEQHSRVGWEFLHGLHRRCLARGFSRIMKSERKACAVAFLRAAVAYYKSLGVTSSGS